MAIRIGGRSMAERHGSIPSEMVPHISRAWESKRAQTALFRDIRVGLQDLSGKLMTLGMDAEAEFCLTATHKIAAQLIRGDVEESIATARGNRYRMLLWLTIAVAGVAIVLALKY